VYDFQSDPKLRATAEGLIDLEEDPKYRKKYATVWSAANAPTTS